MNVTFDQFSTQDVSKILGASPQTVSSWVRKGYMTATNVSDGTEKGRYMFTDEEVSRVQALIKKHGRFKWMRAEQPKKVVAIIPSAFSKVDTLPKVKEDIKMEQKSFNADKVMNKILRLQDLKERLENLEAERNQVLNEIEALRKEIVEVI